MSYIPLRGISCWCFRNFENLSVKLLGGHPYLPGLGYKGRDIST